MENFTEYVRLARDGDKDAFAKLYSLVYKDLYYISLYSLRNKEDAQDVVQDTVVDAFSSIGKLRDENAFRAWIMKILSAKIKRKYKEYAENNVVINYDFEAEELNYDGIDIKQEFNRLSETERLVLSMAVISGYSGAEIANFTGLNANTVRSKLMRAKDKLRERMMGE